MSITICIASRGRPERLKQPLADKFANAISPTTYAAVGFDSDYPTIPDVESDRVVVTFTEREDALGVVNNRRAAACPATIYVLGNDDFSLSTLGWDEKIEKAATTFSDGIGFIATPRPKPWTPPLVIADTAGFVDCIRFLTVWYFPFWWNDTWIEEIAIMIERFVQVGISIGRTEITSRGTRGLIEYVPFWRRRTATTMSARDIAFWVGSFDYLPPLTRQVAYQILGDRYGARDNAKRIRRSSRSVRGYAKDAKFQSPYPWNCKISGKPTELQCPI